MQDFFFGVCNGKNPYPGFIVPVFRRFGIPAFRRSMFHCKPACAPSACHSSWKLLNERVWIQTPVKERCFKEDIFFSLICVCCICFTSLFFQTVLPVCSFMRCLNFCFNLVVAVEFTSNHTFFQWTEFQKAKKCFFCVFCKSCPQYGNHQRRNGIEVNSNVWLELPSIAVHDSGKLRDIQMNLLTVSFLVVWKWNSMILPRLIVTGVLRRQNIFHNR